ncbi:hypothetical protein SKAU_G00281010 [Synaphobranchus kaupii]|uniref:CCHC-type domain-containing protein n=1 Tax=Synaphobranchus kaupii TaxID=118154 RepID=A0A9Q1EX52_SYNKA|nr:hypothetical protein SKAU_G00281010 [Synaphobranchus kaupii]
MSSDGQEVMEQSVVEMALPTRRKFRQLTKDQLLRLAAEQEVESVLKGKAQVAFAALDPRMGLEYESLKMAVLTAYGGVPEAYRQRFRTVKRRDARLAGGSHDLSQGRETSGKGLPLGGKASGAQRPGMEKSHSAVVCHHCREPGHIKPRCPRLKRERDRDIICHGCRRPGHVQSQCPQRSQLESRAKVVALVASLTKRDEGIGCSGPREGPSVSYQPFTSVGTVSVASGGEEVSITILRDTGAAQSLLLEGVIELPRDGFSRSALIKGLGGQYDCVPLYTVHLKSNVVKWPVTVGVVPTLPLPGVSLLLGNDLAGSQVCVTPVVVSTPLEVPETQELEREHPEVFTACVVTRALARKAEAQASNALTPISEEVPCVSATSGEKEHISLAGTVFAKAVSEEGTSAVKGPGFSLSPVADATHFSREVLIHEQNQDPSLAPLWK